MSGTCSTHDGSEMCKHFCLETQNKKMPWVLILVIGLTTYMSSGPGSVVGIATGYGLDGPGIESLECNGWGTTYRYSR
jgi:hypothetical protein